VTASNQPDFDLLYRKCFSPPSVQRFHRWSALYTTYGGRTSPFADPQNINEILALVLSRICSGYFTPRLKTHRYTPGSSVKFVSSKLNMFWGCISLPSSFFNDWLRLSKYVFTFIRSNACSDLLMFWHVALPVHVNVVQGMNVPTRLTADYFLNILHACQLHPIHFFATKHMFSVENGYPHSLATWMWCTSERSSASENTGCWCPTFSWWRPFTRLCSEALGEPWTAHAILIDIAPPRTLATASSIVSK